MASNVITLYLGDGDPSELRQRLNEKAAELGYWCSPRSSAQGRGNLAGLLQAIANGDVSVTRLTPIEPVPNFQEMRAEREARQRESREAKARRARADKLLSRARVGEIMALPLEPSDDTRKIKIALRRAANMRRLTIEFLPGGNGSVRFTIPSEVLEAEFVEKSIKVRGRKKIEEFKGLLSDMTPGESDSVPIASPLDRERTRVWLQIAAREIGAELDFAESREKTVEFVRLAPRPESNHNNAEEVSA